jgi:hypothetical protein
VKALSIIITQIIQKTTKETLDANQVTHNLKSYTETTNHNGKKKNKKVSYFFGSLYILTNFGTGGRRMIDCEKAKKSDTVITMISTNAVNMAYLRFKIAQPTTIIIHNTLTFEKYRL